ncbi:hypothetical protein MXD81_07105 [Microbacteriaceae bacterium K1510]|nr:hypothetical protein [Microbacteriaceae bacterium K1510]
MQEETKIRPFENQSVLQKLNKNQPFLCHSGVMELLAVPFSSTMHDRIPLACLSRRRLTPKEVVIID